VDVRRRGTRESGRPAAPRRLWTLRHGGREATLDLRAVPGLGAKIVLGVDGGELRKTRLYRAHEQAELSGAIADTRATFEANGWT
jgi:hypothetical protein